MIGHLLLAFLMQRASSAILNNCKYNQHLQENTKMKLTSPGYPHPYDPGTVCQWSAVSESNTVIKVECKVNMNSNTDCKKNNLKVSDDKNSKNTRYYCGDGEFHYTTEHNSLFMVLETSPQGPGGTLYCVLEVELSAPVRISSVSAAKPILPPKVESPPDRPPAKCSCGRTNSMKIVGGVETEMNQYPMMVGLYSLLSGALFCGGTIISPQHVVTAAHCLIFLESDEMALLVGGHDVTIGTPYEGLYNILGSFINPDFNVTSKKHDIAVVVPITPIVFSFGVQAACLPYGWTDYDLTLQMVTVVGWGSEMLNGPMSNTLRHTQLIVLPVEECMITYGDHINHWELCTFKFGTDSCQGDSGGPLLWKNPLTGDTVLVGVVSNGIECAGTFPGLNARITNYMDWILSVTGGLYCMV